MALISLKQLLDCAAELEFGVPGFNVNNLEQARAIMQAANKLDSPVIVQVSAGARRYMGPELLRSILSGLLQEWPHIPMCVHQDHGASPAVCLRSIQSGFSSVMMDGSLREDMKTPSDYAYNVAVTSEVVRAAHACGVSVEGELGCLGSLETGLAHEEDGSGAEGVLSTQQMLTDPDEALRFVADTGVDALAIAIGTSHGAYKFSKPPTGEVLAIERIKEIARAVPNTHLVMHGASSVPQDLVAVVNAHGGEMPNAYGVPIEEIQRGIRFGIRKINVDTDLRIAATGAIRKHLQEHPEHFDPRQYLTPALAAMQEVCQARMEAFGCTGMASRIVPKSLKTMVSFYNHG